MAKLRFPIGSFLKHNKTGELVCVRYAYQLETEKGIWIYYLEDRRSMQSPASSLSLILTEMGHVKQPEVIYKPFKSHQKAQEVLEKGMYRYGNASLKRTQDILKNYKLISSGEIISCQ